MPVPPEVATEQSVPTTRRRRRRSWVLGGLVVLAVAGAVVATRPLWEPPPKMADVEALLARKRYADAADGSERLVRSDPDDPRAWYLLARASAGAGRLARAVEALRHIPDWSLRKPDALFFEGKLLLEQHLGRQAEAALRACIARDVSGVGLADNARLELLALCAMEERREAFVDTFWEVYPRLDGPDRLAVLTMRMRLEFEQTKPELNAALLRDYVAKDPEDAQARAGLAAALDHAGDLTAARRLYEEALALAPGDPELRERTLDVLLRAGDMEALTRVLAGRPPGSDDRAEMRKFLGIEAQSRGDSRGAAEHFARAAERRPDVPEYHHRLAQALIRLGRREEAAEATARRTRLNEAREELRKAWNAFATAFEVDPDAVAPELLEAIARACAAAGQSRESGAWADQAARLRQARPAPPPR
jgi:Flp pilus assembly protein TadD